MAYKSIYLQEIMQGSKKTCPWASSCTPQIVLVLDKSYVDLQLTRSLAQQASENEKLLPQKEKLLVQDDWTALFFEPCITKITDYDYYRWNKIVWCLSWNPIKLLEDQQKSLLVVRYYYYYYYYYYHYYCYYYLFYLPMKSYLLTECCRLLYERN